MSINLKEDETVLVQCMIQGLSTLLTNDQLIIITPNKDESYPVQDILAIDVYSDNDKYKEQVKKENRRKVILPILIGFVCGVIPGSIAAFSTKELGVIFGFTTFGMALGLMIIGLGAMSPFKSSKVIKESLLTIILKNGETSQYRFINVDTNERYVKSFAENVFQVVAKKTSMTRFLN